MASCPDQVIRLKRLGLVAIATLLATAPIGFSVPILSAPDDALQTDKPYIVGFDHGVPRDIDIGDAFHDAEVTKVNRDLGWLVAETEEPGTWKEEVKQDRRVKYIEYDDPTYAQAVYTPNDPLYDEPGHWGTSQINAASAWDRTLGTTAITLGVIDSGLRETHEEFADSGRIVDGYDYANDDGDPNDDCGHGTHVSGIAAATIDNGLGIAGMAQVNVMPVKALAYSFWYGCTGSTSDLADAIHHVADNGGHLSSNSWGGGGNSTTLNEAIDDAHGMGTIHVAAAGNSGPCTDCVSSPWTDRPGKSIVVAATDENDDQASFSSQGPEIDVAAPGVDILSTYNGDDSDYETLSGTSMSTPFVSGTAALMLTLDDTLTFDETRSMLKDTAVDLGDPGEDNEYGAGRIDADAATAEAAGGGSNTPPTADFSHDCTDLTCEFDASASSDPDGTITSYDWDFGDGDTGTGETTSHTYDAGGTYTVTLTVEDDDGATDTASDEVDVTEGGGTDTLLDTDFEDDAPGWTVSGLENDLWRLSDDCVTPAGGDWQMAFSRTDPDCDYDVGTAVGWSKAPTLDASGYSTVTLEFEHFWETESYDGEYDVMEVQVSSDGGGSWDEVDQWDASDDNPTDWRTETYDISAYASSELELRWYFDSVDSVSNDYLGWYVDNVLVTAS